jgi:hypothetical protein
LVTASCGGSGSSNPSSPVQTVDPRIALAAKIYSNGPRTPVGFFVETRPVFDGVVATYHIEACANDDAEALAISEREEGTNSTFVSYSSTNEYYEVVRAEYDKTPPVLIRTRVYKCSYFNNGALTKRPLVTADVKYFSEYTWQFTSYNNANVVVLSSTAAGNENTIEMVSYIHSSPCDEFEVIGWVWNLNFTTGELNQHVETRQEFRATNTNGQISICP